MKIYCRLSDGRFEVVGAGGLAPEPHADVKVGADVRPRSSLGRKYLEKLGDFSLSGRLNAANKRVRFDNLRVAQEKTKNSIKGEIGADFRRQRPLVTGKAVFGHSSLDEYLPAAVFAKPEPLGARTAMADAADPQKQLPREWDTRP